MEKKTRNLHGMLSLVVSALVVALLFFHSSLAWAEDAAPTALSRFTTELLELLIPIFVTTIGAMATWVLYKVKEKFHINISDAVATQWGDLAEKAALRGAEYARSKAKDLTDGKKIPGPEVLEVAANWAIDMGNSLKLPQLASDKLRGLIEAHLFKLRMMDEQIKTNMVAAAGATITDMDKLSRV